MILVANMNISISGGEAFETYLNTQIKVSERAIPVVKRNGAAMQHLAMKYAPVKTGYLKRNITLTHMIGLAIFSSQIDGKANYDSYQEYGTRFMAGTPHIRPAFIFQSKTFINEMEGLVKD